MEWQEPAPARRSWGGLKPQSCWEPALPTLRTAGGSRTLQSWLPPPPTPPSHHTPCAGLVSAYFRSATSLL